MNTSAKERPVVTEEMLHDAFRRLYDPEFGVSIEDLGLIYDIRIDGGKVSIGMTLTTMSCPAGQVIMDGVKAAAEAVPGVESVEVRLIWDPPWSPEMLSDAAREQLGWRG